MTAPFSLPATFRKIQVHTLSSDFRAATRVVTVPMTAPTGYNVLVAVTYCGINASDINFTAGKYLRDARPPFDAGFECVGTVVRVGDKVTKVQVGQHVMLSAYGCFTEYMLAPEKIVVVVPAPSAAMLPLLVSGLTASLALEQAGRLLLPFSRAAAGSSTAIARASAKVPPTVLVTAAAGGTNIRIRILHLRWGNQHIYTWSVCACVYSCVCLHVPMHALC